MLANIRETNFHVSVFNKENKESVLLVHGHPFDNTMWNYQLDALKNYHLILPDLKGYGGSDYNFSKIFIEEQALDLAVLLDQMQNEKIHLVGLSMGGQIIIEFYRLFPDRVLSLTLCNCSPKAETPDSYKDRLSLADEIEKNGMRAYTKKEIHNYLHSNTLLQQPLIYQHLYQMMKNTPRKGAVASHRGRAERRDNYEFLQYIKIPVLVIAGDADLFNPANDMKEMAEEIENSEFVIIENSGHLPNMEQPKAFNSALNSFLEKHKLQKN